MNINKLKLNGEYRVAMANDLITGHQRMTLRGSQIISIAVSNIVKEDKDFNESDKRDKVLRRPTIDEKAPQSHSRGLGYKTTRGRRGRRSERVSRLHGGARN